MGDESLPQHEYLMEGITGNLNPKHSSFWWAKQAVLLPQMTCASDHVFWCISESPMTTASPRRLLTSATCAAAAAVTAAQPSRMKPKKYTAKRLQPSVSFSFFPFSSLCIFLSGSFLLQVVQGCSFTLVGSLRSSSQQLLPGCTHNLYCAGCNPQPAFLQDSTLNDTKLSNTVNKRRS